MSPWTGFGHALVRSLHSSTKLFLPLLLFAAAGATRAATTIYATGFEPPTYSAGTINGQDGWSTSAAPASAIIESTVVKTGIQALEVNTALGTTGLPGAGHNITYNSTSTAEKILDAQVDFQIANGGTPSYWTALHLDLGLGGGTDINVDQNRHLIISDEPTTFDTGVVVTSGVWHHYELRLDFSTHTFVAYYDGALVAPARPFGSSATQALFVGLYNQGNGTDIGYYDNLDIVSAVPAPAPTFSKSFGSLVVPSGQTTSLSFQITNPNSTPLTNVSFSDTLPPGLSFTNAPLTDSCSAAPAAIVSGTLQFSGTLAANESCTVSATVTAPSAGSYTNLTSPISSLESGPGGTATASVVFSNPPTISKAFGSQYETPGVPVTLTFTLSNPNANSLSQISFSDPLPGSLKVASPAGVTDTCGGAVSATPGNSTIGLSGGMLNGTATCTIVVNVVATQPGALNNFIPSISSAEGGSGGGGSASIYVVAPPIVVKSFGAASIPLNGSTTLTISITNPGYNANGYTNLHFTDNLPGKLAISSPSNVSTNCPNGSVSTTTNSVSLGGATLQNGSICSVTVHVTGTAAGVAINNVTVNSDEGSGNSFATITVVGPPTIAKAFGVNSIALNGATSLTFTITNPNATTALSNVGFTDALPSGLLVSSPNQVTNSCNGTVIAIAGSGTVALTGGTIPLSGQCVLSVNVTGIAPGIQNNVTGAVTSTEGGTGNTASASVTVMSPPSIAKLFHPAAFAPGGTSTLTFTITNPNASPLSGIGFTDVLPAGLKIASPNNLTNTCNGTPAALPTAPSGDITLTGGTVAASSFCTLSVSVAAAKEGIYNNVTSVVTSTEGGNGNTASATVTVASTPTITKSFSAVAIPAGGSAVLTFTITNPNQNVPITGVAFTDTLPAGLLVSTPDGVTGSCGGPITAVAGSSTISLTGGSLPAPGSCTFSVNVTATATGAITNITGAITSDQTGPGSPASATITAGSVFQVNYAANLNDGDSVIDLTNTGENGASLYGPGLGAPAGNVCVNVYALAPDEELLACCSCLVTPDGLASLSVNNDLIGNTANGAKPNSIVVKLVTTLAGAGGSGSGCTNSAATAGTVTSGLGAWRTTLHAAPPGGFANTEVPFTQATLSAQELASLSGRCTAIIGNNSGAGICKSCRSTGLGAQRDAQ